uniref:Uncharacterized protein n=1 Tax=Arundo donax TaxID=35708 RepID=A0A0A9AQN4_ARUDO
MLLLHGWRQMTSTIHSSPWIASSSFEFPVHLNTMRGACFVLLLALRD